MTTSQWIEQAKTTLGNLVAVDVATRDARSRLIAEVPTDWISVKDGLPEERDSVLFYGQYGLMLGSVVDKTGSLWVGVDSSFSSWDVTHWSPLPKPPEPA